MNKDLATEIMAATAKVGAELNKVSDIIEQISDIPERTKFRRGIAGLMADIFIKIERPIIQEHPELDPDLPS